MSQLERLMSSIEHGLRIRNQEQILLMETQFVLSNRAARLVRSLIGRQPAVSADGVYFGSPLQTAIIQLVADLHVVSGLTRGDWIYCAMAHVFGVTDEQICARPPGSIPAQLPRYLRPRNAE